MPAPEPELPYCNACREGGELCDYHLREELAGIRLANADLHKYIGELEQRNAELEAENAELRKRTTCTFTVGERESFSLPKED